MVFNGTPTKLRDVITEKRVSDVNCRICYHQLDDLVDDPGNFSVLQQFAVCFITDSAEKDATEISQFNFGMKTSSVAAWNDHCTQILWIVRWTTKGLQPVKPVVVITKEVILPTGRALIIND